MKKINQLIGKNQPDNNPIKKEFMEDLKHQNLKVLKNTAATFAYLKRHSKAIKKLSKLRFV